MKPADVKPSIYIDFNKEVNKESPKFKVGDYVRKSKYKYFLQNAMFEIGLKKFLWLIKLKTLCRRHILLVILTEKKSLEHFIKKNWKKQNKTKLG